MQGVNILSLSCLKKKSGLPPIAPVLVCLTSLAITSGAYAQSVVPDGGTATSVTLSATGQITVGIAPTGAGSISHNTYSDFSVPTSGVNLDNSVVSAGTILNEVTSAKITTIEGELNVIGPTTDVIIANPNGITVNGGRFLNTRNLALTTGVPGRDASGRITTTVTAGEISVGPGGLSGTMEELALISKSLKIDGAVTHDAINSDSRINIVAGDNTVNFDAGRPGGGILPWALPTDRGSSTTNQVLVDITRHGSLHSGRIRLAVTDAGAGVRFAGDQVASAGGFRLTHDGRIEINETVIAATGSVNIKASSAKLTSSNQKRTEITSDAGGVVLELQTGDLELGSAKLSGATIASDNLASLGGVTLLVEGKIVSAPSSYGQVAEISSSASGVVATSNAGFDIDGLFFEAFEDLRLGANGAISFSGVSGTIGGEFAALTDGSLSFKDITIDIAESFAVDADGPVSISGGKSVVGEELSIETQGTLNIADFDIDTLRRAQFEAVSGIDLSKVSGTVGEAADFSTDGSLRFDTVTFDTMESLNVDARGAVHLGTVNATVGDDLGISAGGPLYFQASKLSARNNIRLDAAYMQFGSRSKSQKRTELTARSGGLIAKTTVSDILNFGSLLQGALADRSDPDARGGVTLDSAGGITNESLSVNRLAVAFGQLDDLHISAGGDIKNSTGRFFSNRDIIIKTPGDIINETQVVGEVTPYTIQSYKGGRFASSLFLKRSKKLRVFASFGQQVVKGERSFILGAGDVALQAANIENIGGDIIGAAVDLMASERFRNEARQSGRLSFSQSCKFFCKTTGYSDVKTVGGNVSASEQLNITALGGVTSIAGQISGARGINIKSPITRFVPLLTSSFIDQRSGAGSLFGARPGLLVADYLTGVLQASAGRITIDGDVELGETSVLSKENIEVTGNRIKSSQLPEQVVIGRQPIGFFWNLF